ncbi:MAG: response regulator [Azonexus sp.]|jgi:FixJ family two-component response regulator|uniref:response regulator transcription factor n=1 Tax=Azonexus sp. TaxID=1872668 RepID=UPI002836971A|nr:response regulator [Azonexus sp.]MDR0775377.1 response regulator [Azonexus sp.]
MSAPAIPSQVVYIVDDDADIRDALALLMRSAGLSAASFPSARDFLARVTPRDSGCLVLDIRMPGTSGIELQAEMRKRRIELPIIFLTGHGDVPLAVKAMQAGAADFIQKPLEEHRLVMAVTQALKEDACRLRSEDPADNPPDDRLASLSRREREVLQEMVRGRQSREIAETLGISIKTVEFHRANIREKLGTTNLADLFRLVFKQE